MMFSPGRTLLLLLFPALTSLTACGGESDSAPVSTAQPTVVSTSAEGEAGPASEQAAAAAEEAVPETQVIEEDELEPAGEIELKQYTVAWVGSGTMGGGTLTMDGKEYPFRLAGLGVGGYGASSIDATGIVYNLPSLDAFPGTYGNARLGMTGGDSGGGKLWLRNPDGVVIELKSEMRGLALAGGVDGILIQWEDEEDSQVDEAMDGTRDVAGDAIESGADAVQGGVDKVKGWLKKD
jgi:hypothetical protein